jgi:hypothetical protein
MGGFVKRINHVDIEVFAHSHFRENVEVFYATFQEYRGKVEKFAFEIEKKKYSKTLELSDGNFIFFENTDFHRLDGKISLNNIQEVEAEKAARSEISETLLSLKNVSYKDDDFYFDFNVVEKK